MLDRAAGKLFPVMLPLIFKDSDTGTGNISGNDSWCVFGGVLVYTSLAKLNQQSSDDHWLLIHAASSGKTDSGCDQSGLDLTRWIQNHQSQAMVGEQLACLQKGKGIWISGQGDAGCKRT